MRILLPLLFILSFSCTTTKHAQVASTNTEYQRAVDSMTHVLSETTRMFESQIQNIATGGIVFDTLFIPGDTMTNTVTINGGVIHAAGKIQKVYYKDVQTVTERDYWHKVADSLSTHRDTTAIKVVTEYKDRTVKRTVFPWWWIVIGGVVVIGVLYGKQKLKI